jgi:hypothetical protein
MKGKVMAERGRRDGVRKRIFGGCVGSEGTGKKHGTGKSGAGCLGQCTDEKDKGGRVNEVSKIDSRGFSIVQVNVYIYINW